MSRLTAAAALLAGIAAAPQAIAHPSRGIAVTADGTVYFSDLIRIWRVDRNGLQLVHRNPGTHTHALAIDPSGRLVWEESAYDPAAQRYRETIWQLSGKRVMRRFGPLSPPPRGLGITTERGGCTFHADQLKRGGPALVHRWCPSAPPVRLVGSAAEDAAFRPALVQDIGGTALAPDGRFYFRQGGGVRSVDRHGRAQLVTNTIADENFGIAVERSGALLVAEHSSRRILRIAGGRKRVVARSPIGWAPTGVASAGTATYVLEASDYRPRTPARMRVRQVAADGRSRLLAQVTVPQP